MSVSSMTNVAFARRRDVEPLDEAPTTAAGVGAAKGDRAETQSAVTAAAAAITTYIPTEILTVYVAVLGALNTTASVTHGTVSEWAAFWGFLVLTPVVVWLAYAGKVRRAGKALPTAPRAWPRWEMTAATLAFIAWAFAMPATPFGGVAGYNPALAGIAVLVVTTALGLLAPVIARPLDA